MEKLWSRCDKKFIEQKELKQGFVSFLYKTALGRILLKLIFARRWFSALAGALKSTKHSAKKLPQFIKENNIDLSKCDKAAADFISFNDFFTRRETRVALEGEKRLIAPCDGKLSVRQITPDLLLNIKGTIYSVAELLESRAESEKFANGFCFVYRLSLTDYHRYYFIDSGNFTSYKIIKGVLHTVRSVSAQYKAFSKNSREISILESENFGVLAHIEIGAMLAGKICNYKKSGRFSKMEEKGYFSYGGSTIVQLFASDTILPDVDIMQISAQNAEIIVCAGEGVGESILNKFA